MSNLTFKVNNKEDSIAEGAESYENDTCKDEILNDVKELIEESTLESCELAVKKLASIKGWKNADELLDSESTLLKESLEYKKNCLAELDDSFTKIEKYFKKVSIWKRVFFINIFLMIISALAARLVMSDSEIFMIFGIPMLVFIVLLLTLFVVSLIKMRQFTHKFEILTIGRKTNIFRDRVFFTNKIQNVEIEILNAQKYIISVELILNEIENIKA